MIPRLAAALGYDIRRKSSEHRDDTVFPDWKSALYESSDPGTARFLVPVSVCTDALGFRYSTVEGRLHGDKLIHPYSRTIAAYASNLHRTYEESPLWHYYREFCPDNGCDIFPEAPALSRFPADTHLTPWLAGDIAWRLKKTRINIQKEFPAIRNPGNPMFGPVSDEQGLLEYRRLVGVYTSILERGFQLSSDRRNDVTGFLLRRNEEVRYIVTKGKHRIAAVGVADPDGSVPVSFRRAVVLDDRDIPEWPLVRTGLWSATGARAYVDRLFSGRPITEVKGSAS